MLRDEDFFFGDLFNYLRELRIMNFKYFKKNTTYEQV